MPLSLGLPDEGASLQSPWVPALCRAWSRGHLPSWPGWAGSGCGGREWLWGQERLREALYDLPDRQALPVPVLEGFTAWGRCPSLLACDVSSSGPLGFLQVHRGVGDREDHSLPTWRTWVSGRVSGACGGKGPCWLGTQGLGGERVQRAQEAGAPTLSGPRAEQAVIRGPSCPLVWIGSGALSCEFHASVQSLTLH